MRRQTDLVGAVVDELADAVVDGVREVVVEVVRLERVAAVHLDVRLAQQLLDVLARAGDDGDDGHPELARQALRVDLIAGLARLVHKIERKHHRDLQLQQLRREVEVAL